MHRALLALPPVVAVVTLSAALLVGSSVGDAPAAEATATQYNVTRVLGPFNGTLAVGATVPCSPARAGCAQSAPGSIDPDAEASDVWCNNNRDVMLGGSAVINLKTSHGTAKTATVDLDRIGAHYDPEADITMRWGTFVRPNGKSGWSSVTITATCLVRK